MGKISGIGWNFTKFITASTDDLQQMLHIFYHQGLWREKKQQNPCQMIQEASKSVGTMKEFTGTNETPDVSNNRNPLMQW